MKQTLFGKATRYIAEITNINEYIDTSEAAEKIKGNIWFRGPNLWILAFSIIIASVGLNVNSTAVIIGAMLISPLMGPIMGAGLALGTNNAPLLKEAFKNLLVMVTISLLASWLYFLISPLNLVNPTELLARTRPSIYDVLIAFFGGLAGIFESCRREKGTVLSGVAIATALMPPLCTAGYGLAYAQWKWFGGAMMLFLINAMFIIIATYFMVKLLRFKEVGYPDEKQEIRTRRIVSLIILAIMVPSIWSAVIIVRDNNFERNVQSFVAENKNMQEQGYIYDYKILDEGGKMVELYIAGESPDDEVMSRLAGSAARHGIKENQLRIRHTGSSAASGQKLMQSIYERVDAELARKDERIRELEKQLEEKDRSSLQDVKELLQVIFRDSTVVVPAPETLRSASGR